MGNEIFYCTRCGIRVSGADVAFGQASCRDDRYYCRPCLGLRTPPPALPAPQRETSKRIRRVAVSPAKSRATDRRPRRSGRVAVLVGLAVIGAATASVLAVTASPSPLPDRPPAPAAALFAPVPPPRASLAPAAPPEPAPDPERAEFLRRLDELQEQALREADPEQGDGMLDALHAAAARAARLAPERAAQICSWEQACRARHEALADSLHDSIVESAGALADEGRFEDALARIRAFPKGLRRSRAWSSLDALQRQIELRAR
jgi:hypothetical protein